MELKKRKRRYLQISLVLIKRFPFTLPTYATVAIRLGLVAKAT
jgi:hypothetical protein